MLASRSSSTFASCSRSMLTRASKKLAIPRRAASTSSSPILDTSTRTNTAAKAVFAASAAAFLTYEVTNKGEMRLDAAPLKNVLLTSPTASLHAGIDELGVFLWGSNKYV